MDTIGEYQVRRLVGEGGMGKVYEAEERLSGRRVALKVLRPELTGDEDGRRLFTNEMRILAQLEHESLVRSLASFEHEGQLVLVLEFLEGDTLRVRLQKGAMLPWMEAVDVGARIAAALEVAHARDVVPRDLKPENVMLTSDGGVKVMDFGVAKVLQNATGNVPSQSVGTLQYMRPEQIDAKPVDGRSDLYALGLLLYEMITGQAPFRSASPRELLNLQCTAEPAPITIEIPRGVRDVVQKLLAKKPEDRPASASIVAAALAPFLLDRPVPVKPKIEVIELETTIEPAKETVQARTPMPVKDAPLAPKAPPAKAAPSKTASKLREVAGRKAAVVLVAAGLLSFALTFAVRQQMAEGKNFSEAVSSLVKSP
ncbi:hypothetical protein BH09MYX1_BH09MYX1_12250 [soil metagenome]